MRRVTRTPLQVCSVAQNCLAEAYLNQLLRTDPSVQVLDLKHCVQRSAPRRSGIVFVIDLCGLEMPLYECLKELRKQCSDAKFLALDDHNSKEEIVRMLVMGVHGYVPHHSVPSTLVRAISCVGANHLWLPPELLPEFLTDVGSVLQRYAGQEVTTPREDEILELVRRRLSNREISELLHVSLSTVKFHVSNILSKLHANNRRELAGISWQSVWKMQSQ